MAEQTGGGPNDEYEAWTARVREGGADSTGPGSYWSTESLFRDSQLEVEREKERKAAEAKRDEKAAASLRVLGLTRGATLQQAAERYRSMARQLHPDANLEASEAERSANIDRMVEINAAYAELKRLLS